MLLLGAWLRFHALAQDARFHPDEALYNTFARDAVLQGRWMLPGLLDKPPLMIYANALSMAFVGAADNGNGVLDFPSVRVGEFAGRLPNTLVSFLTLAVTYALAKRLYRQQNPSAPQSILASHGGGSESVFKNLNTPPGPSPYTERGANTCGKPLSSWKGVWGEVNRAFSTPSQTLPYTREVFLPLSTQWRGGRGVRIDLLALLLISLSPFAIAFSATAFTDVFMTFWMLAALWMITLDRWGVAGICLALGFASKQPALFYLPLILAVGWRMYGWSWRRLSRFALALALGIALLLLWDLARNQPSIWQVSSGRENYPNRLIHADEVLPRLQIWLTYTGTMLGSGWLTGLLVMLAMLESFHHFFSNHWFSRVGTRHSVSVPENLHSQAGGSETLPYAPDVLLPLSTQGRGGRGVRITDFLILYILAYFFVHWWVAFNTFDRYLLPIVPLVAILAGQGVAYGCWLLATGLEIVRFHLYRRSMSHPDEQEQNSPLRTHHSSLIPHYSYLIPVLLLCAFALSLTAFDASEGRIAGGGDLGKHDGIDILADYLNSKPVATVIYDHWLGWELGYYMGVWNNKRRVYYPTPEALARDALALDEIGARYFPVPAEVDASVWLTALREAGFGVAEVYRLERFVVYELMPPK
jgi:4-amino-4-deoxy-L-arabinose transferase-like glycosyltransferase